MVGFETMIFNYNEGMHAIGLLPKDKYISGAMFIGNILQSSILTYGFFAIVLSKRGYAKIFEKYSGYLILIFMTLFFGSMYYFKQYGILLFFTSVIVLTLVIGVRKEFKGLREWLDEKFGWMF